MSYLGFLADFAMSGQVAGVGLNSRPADWPPALGDDFVESSFAGDHLVRGFGIIEAHFEDDTGAWLCNMIHIKPGSGSGVPGVIADRYGQFPSRVGFDGVADVLAAADATVRHLPRTSKYASEFYWVPEGQVMFHVVSPVRAGDFAGLGVGDVHSVIADTRLEIPDDYGTLFR